MIDSGANLQFHDDWFPQWTVPLGTTYRNGILEIPANNPFKLDLRKYFSGDNITIMDNVLAVNGNVIKADVVDRQSGILHVGNADVFFAASSSEPYHVDNVNYFGHANIEVKGGRNVKYNGENSSEEYPDDLFPSPKVSVEEADEVGYACVVAINAKTVTVYSYFVLRPSAFTEMPGIHFKQYAPASYDIVGCDGTNFTFNGFADNSSIKIPLSFSSETSIRLQNAAVNITKNDITESLFATGTSTGVIHKYLGFTKINLTPSTTYIYDTGTPTTTFSFRTVNEPFMLYIKKEQSQRLPAFFQTCNQCGVVDLVSSVVDIRGVVEYAPPKATDPLDRLLRALQGFFT